MRILIGMILAVLICLTINAWMMCEALHRLNNNDRLLLECIETIARRTGLTSYYYEPDGDNFQLRIAECEKSMNKK